MRPAWPGGPGAPPAPGAPGRSRAGWLAGQLRSRSAQVTISPGHDQRGVSTTMGVVVGALVPPAGSTVTPTASSEDSPDASTSTAAALSGSGVGTRPAGRTP